MLKLDVRIGDNLRVGDATIKVVKKHGTTVSLAIDAPKEIQILLITQQEAEARKEAGNFSIS